MSNERYLFRGKRIDNGDWVYGSLMQTIDQTKVENVYHMAHIYEGVNISAPIKVITETVGQFTGLTDKNGVKIFEGDRFKTLNGFIGRIEWGHKVYLDKKNRYEFHGWLYVNDSNNHSETLDSEILAGEVIGSIHDNDKRA